MNAGIVIGSNLLRAVMTTECYEAFLDGKITARGKEAVDRVGMHGAAVVRQHYLQRNQEAAARSSLEVGQALRSPAIGPVLEATRPRFLTEEAPRSSIPTYANTNFLSLHWGTNHSCGGDDSKKASWDQAELDDLYSKYATISQRFAGRVIPPHTPIVPQLLKMVHADPEAVPIYAKRHILDSGRLATGIYDCLLTISFPSARCLFRL